MIIKTIVVLFLSLISVSSLYATSPQTDYNYQLTQYRKHNAEFKILKEDNQQNPTLDNQQKALQAAKQTIISRDTSKITYIELLLSQIRSQKLTQDHVLQTERDLLNVQEFYRNQIKLAKEIISIEDLTNFTLNYLQAQVPHQNKIIKAQATNKLAALIRLQVNIKNAHDGLLPKIDDTSLTPISAGLSRINQLADEINNKILQSINSITFSEVTNHSKPNFYSKEALTLSQIQVFQSELINILIDLEKNYAN